MFRRRWSPDPGICLCGVIPELFELTLEIFVFVKLCLQESDGDLGFLLDSFRREEIKVSALAFVPAKVVCLDQAFSHQCLKAVIDTPETDPKFPSNVALGGARIVFQQLENAVSVFVGQHSGLDSNLMFNR